MPIDPNEPRDVVDFFELGERLPEDEIDYDDSDDDEIDSY